MTAASRRTTLVLYTNLEVAYRLAAGWCERNDARLLLVVTTPGPPARRSDWYRTLLAALPPEQDALITTRPRRTAPLVQALRPDLVLSMSFPYRLPPEVLAAPRLGAVNLHPAPLPEHRGPNPMRRFYDAAPTVGATLHRTEAEFDTGPILSKVEQPMPADPSPESVLPPFVACIGAALDQGLARALAGDPGEAQDDSRASYAAAFTDADYDLDWNLPTHTLLCRATALNFFAPAARVRLGEQPRTLVGLRRLADTSPPGPPGTVLALNGAAATVCTADGVVLATLAE
jgi:methionyl-tRNA formyltransferase